jgi:RepB DNA-primase from phage plasmid
MGAGVFEVGLFKPDARNREPVMLPRVWDHDSLVRSIGWLRHENWDGRNIYVRPQGEHNLSLVDDLKAGNLVQMEQAGFTPAVVIETSPCNFQAWLKHPEQLSKEMGTAAARALAVKFGGDRGAADWRHYGRLAGFTNRKEKYRDDSTSLYPFVKVIQATGAIYSAAEEFLKKIRAELEERHRMEQQRRATFSAASRAAVGSVHEKFKSISKFRSDRKYGGDGTRIDLAFAIYALSHGASTADVESAIRTRDLSHKGSEKRQADHIERTMKKALAVTDRSR